MNNGTINDSDDQDQIKLESPRKNIHINDPNDEDMMMNRVMGKKKNLTPSSQMTNQQPIKGSKMGMMREIYKTRGSTRG